MRSTRLSILCAHLYPNATGKTFVVPSNCHDNNRISLALSRFQHFLEVHGNNPIFYACHCCERFFKTGKSLSVHLIKKHGFRLPSGHKRFSYRIDENGFYRLEMTRIESLEVTQQILAPHIKQETDLNIALESSCYEIVNPIGTDFERIIVSNDANEAHLVGEVTISLPSLNDAEF